MNLAKPNQKQLMVSLYICIIFSCLSIIDHQATIVYFGDSALLLIVCHKKWPTIIDMLLAIYSVIELVSKEHISMVRADCAPVNAGENVSEYQVC